MKRTILLVLMVLATGLFPAGANAQTYIFQLTQNGRPMGNLGIQLDGDARNAGPIQFNSTNNFLTGLERYELLENICRNKTGAVNFREPKGLTQLTEGNMRWAISTTPQYVRVQRYENKKERPVDDLMINPIRPVYDIISLIIALQQRLYSDSFDFYLLEREHEKQLRLEKPGWSFSGNSKWPLKYKKFTLAEFEFELGDPKKPLKMSFENSYFNDLRGFELTLQCVRPGGLSAGRVLTSREILRKYNRMNGSTTSDAATCEGKFLMGSEGIEVSYKNCLNFKIPIGPAYKDWVIGQLKPERLNRRRFRKDQIEIFFNPETQKVCAQFLRGTEPFVYQKTPTISDRTCTKFLKKYGINGRCRNNMAPFLLGPAKKHYSTNDGTYYTVMVKLGDYFCKEVEQIDEIVRGANQTPLRNPRIDKDRNSGEIFLNGTGSLVLTETDIRTLYPSIREDAQLKVVANGLSIGSERPDLRCPTAAYGQAHGSRYDD